MNNVSITAEKLDQFFYKTDPTDPGERYTLRDLIMIFELARAQNLEQQMAAELENIQYKNSLLAESNSHLEVLRNAKANGPSPFTIPLDTRRFFEKHNVPPGNNSQDNDQLEITIENLKGFVDDVNSRSQLDMLRVSDLLKKRDESFTLPVNTNKSLFDLNKLIIGGVRA